MATNKTDIIEFNILVGAEGAGTKPDLSNLDRFRPDPADIERCRRWLAGNGVTCYTTEFGLACSAPCNLFESLFSTEVRRSKRVPGKPPWKMLTKPVPPPEIADYIEDVTISAPPELF
jgi:hypothetical protein